MSKLFWYLKTALEDLPKLVPLPKYVFWLLCRVQDPECVFRLRHSPYIVVWNGSVFAAYARPCRSAHYKIEKG